jgi:(p)ppGpp synthase/HD superfamily hydrolase
MLPISTQYNPAILNGIDREWNLISKHYGERRAERSQVPLINHIIEGVTILHNMKCDYATKAAFCIHPIIQSDGDLAINFDHLANVVSADVLALAMEYRSVANEYLSHRKIENYRAIRLSPLRAVNDMLVADKIQNYKDFIIYHHNTHPRGKELHEYFQNWLYRLECHDLMEEYVPGWSEYAVG